MSLRRLLIASSCVLLLCGCPGESPSKTTNPGDSAGDADGGKTESPPQVAPVEVKPFDRETAKTPWKYAKVGDWATYKMHGANKELKFEITKVDGNMITFTVTDTKTGEKINEPTIDIAEEEGRYKDPMTYDALAKDKDGNTITPYTEAVEVKGKKLEALVIKREKSGMGSTELWIAEKDVRPFNQCAVKSIRNGKLELELLDFGGK